MKRSISHSARQIRRNRRQSRKNRQKRPLRLEAFEARRLLAADLAPPPEPIELPESPSALVDVQASFEAEDVNRDGQVTPMDSLMIINRIGRLGTQRGDDINLDTNGDGQITPIDALRIINRMSRRAAQQDGNRPGENQPPPEPPQSPSLQEIQSLDGTNNNLENPEIGAAGTEFVRLVDADYADGIDEPSGQDRASAREISNLVAAQEESLPSQRGLSDYIWQFGQFIDHDIDLTAGAEGGTGEAFNIAVPDGDPYFDPFGTGTEEISLTRSEAAEGTGVDTGVTRQQVNQITSFIDGSMVYGSDAERADALRSFEGGRLLTSEGDLLPFNTSGLDNAGGPSDTLYLAGDVRANEQVGLLAMHTLWVREHNRVADQIAADNPEFNDEEIYQSARRIVIGELQVITFNEYLPALLGRDALDPYQGYDPTVDASISNLFATAGFRYGHSTLSSEILRLDDSGEVIEAGNLALRNAFFNPSAIAEGGVDSILKGLSAQRSQEVDTQVVDDLRNFLFGAPGSGGFDLASLNIQRGRDHGIPDYNSVREQLGLERAETFADITSDPELQAALEEAYGDTSDMDLWVGALAEDHQPGASVGETLQTIIADQFSNLRDGDRFWYQNVLTGETLRQVSQTRLSDVIERNTSLTSLQDNVFFVEDAGPNADRPDGPGPDGPGPDGPGPDGPGPDGPGPDGPGPDGPGPDGPGPDGPGPDGPGPDGPGPDGPGPDGPGPDGPGPDGPGPDGPGPDGPGPDGLPARLAPIADANIDRDRGDDGHVAPPADPPVPPRISQQIANNNQAPPPPMQPAGQRSDGGADDEGRPGTPLPAEAVDQVLRMMPRS